MKALFIAVALLFGVVSIGQASSPTRVYIPLLMSAADVKTEVLNAVNVERAQAGRPPLRMDARLVKAAQRHADDMAANGFFDHTGSDGSTPGDRMRQAGYNWTTYGEALAGRSDNSARAAVQQWHNSPPHYRIMTGSQYRDAGVGVKMRSDGFWLFVLNVGAE